MSGEAPPTPEQVTASIPERVLLVRTARLLERALLRRRKLVKQLQAEDDIIRHYRKLIHDLSMPLPEPGEYARAFEDSEGLR